MDMRSKERFDELPAVETPDDVAVLYSWANLHGAKYRDFSASRREYRAQLRHRAAEQARELELRAQAKAENAATFAEKAARQAEEVAMSNQAQETEYSHQQALRDATEAARVAAAERIEAARRAEAVALAEASARREQREIADANASARRQAAQYADSEVRRRQAERRDIASDLPAEIPGEISDPYTPQSHAQPRQAVSAQPPPPDPRPVQHPADQAFRTEEQLPTAKPVRTPPQPPAAPAVVDYTPEPQPLPPAPPSQPARRPQGYRPDDASGVRQIYRGPEFDLLPRDNVSSQPARQVIPIADRPQLPPQPSSSPSASWNDPRVRAGDYSGLGQRTPAVPHPLSQPDPQGRDRASAWADGVASNVRREATVSSLGNLDLQRPDPHQPASTTPAALTPDPHAGGAAEPRMSRSRSLSRQSTDDSIGDPTPRRRRQDTPEYKQEHPSDPKATPNPASGQARRREDAAPQRGAQQAIASTSGRSVDDPAPRFSAPEPSGPAWL